VSHNGQGASSPGAATGAASAAGSEADDPRITRAIEEYLDALKAGRRPDRRQFLARHPDIAPALAECLGGLELIRAAASELHHPSGSPPVALAGPLSVLSLPAQLGDYRLLREIGRGGMGVVYEAEQISLGRRVALKVLPFAAALDPRQLQRFQNEAQAAAHLQHGNIVPVHAVGCDGGVHYYVMQYVEGQTVAALIRELRQLAGLEEVTRGQPPAAGGPAAAQADPEPTPRLAASLSTERSLKRPGFFRAVAELGVQAALALEHAHQLGVIHRDIKPANLLVDGRGHLWVTDFGLAHVLGDPKLTLTGDLVGTLRYMSPEQALAQRVIVDHRTDVYSLGATLYELLTLEPPFRGHDRQELLRQIATEDPQPPRRLDPAVPADLETVVLKALAKEPEGRYTTAQELADDLRRFLEDKPIRARKPNLPQRAAKWARRHRAVVVSAAVVLVLAVPALLGSLVLVQMARQEVQRERDAARWAVDDMYTNVAEQWLENEPEMEEVQREFLLKALHYYATFPPKGVKSAEDRFAAALAYRRVGDIQQKLGDFARAEEAYGSAVQLCDHLARGFRNRPRFRAALAQCRHNFGGLLAQMKRPTEAEREYRAAVSLRENLLAREPDSVEYRHDLAASATELGRVLQGCGRPEEAEKEYYRALQLLEAVVSNPERAEADRDSGSLSALQPQKDAASQNLLGTLQSQLAGLSWSRGQLNEAAQLLQRAIDHQRLALKFRPRNATTRKNLAGLLERLAQVQRRLRAFTEAEAAYRQALTFQEKLTEDFPRVPHYWSDLARMRQELGDLLTARGRREEAGQAYAWVLVVRKQLVQKFPAVPAYCRDLAWLLATCADPQFRDAAQAVRLARQAVERAPQGGDCWRALGVACYRAGDWRGAVTALGKATDLHAGGDSTEWFFLAMAHWQLGERSQARDWYTRAVPWMEKNRPGDEQLQRFHAEAASLLDPTNLP
jgi:serine/threonine protein kinase